MRKKLNGAVICLTAISLTAISLTALAVTATAADTNVTAPDMLVTTTSSLEGFKIKEYKGIVRGVIVRQPTIGQGLSANFERLKGGNISAYTNMAESARQQSYDLCISRAREIGANAVIGMQYDSSAFEHGQNVATEVICYGTAVTIERAP